VTSDAAARRSPDAEGGAKGLPRVLRVHVVRDDNDGGRESADFGDVTAALTAVTSHMSLPGVYSILITFDD
jgi:hypothetical protein